MKAYLINPYDRTISARDLYGKDRDVLDAMYKVIECASVDRVVLSPTIDLWVDDDGHMTAGKPIFELFASLTRFAGRGLVLAHDGEGNSAAADFPIEKLLEAVRWTELETTGQLTKGYSEGSTIYSGTPISTIRSPDQFLIWSNEHRAWWGPGWNGYTPRLKEAGRYSRQHALRICLDAQGGWDGMKPPPEVPVREIDAIAAGLAGRFTAPPAD